MKNCTDCKHAKWHKTKANKLHPSGEGICRFPYIVKKLPASMWWTGTTPFPSGGSINRHEELHEHCVYYQDRNIK